MEKVHSIICGTFELCGAGFPKVCLGNSINVLYECDATLEIKFQVKDKSSVGKFLSNRF